MSKLLLILFICLLTCGHEIIGQTTLISNDIVKLTIENFPESSYYKELKTKPEITTSFISAKTIDSGCIHYQTKEFNFKKENITFVFTNNYDTTKVNYLESICIKGEHTPFITEDSIIVGDKIPITVICKDVDKLKEQHIKRNNKYVDHIFYKGINYCIENIRTEKINPETRVKVNKIIIRSYEVKNRH